MSKKNNKKNSTRKNFKIESLEPRLMMDAAANDWLEENTLTDTTSIDTSFDSLHTNLSLSSDYSSLLGSEIDGLSQQPQSSNNYERTPVKFSDVFDVGSNVFDNIKNSNEYKNIHDLINVCVDECRADACAKEKAVLDAATQALETVKNKSGVLQLEIDAVQKLVEAAQKDYKDALDKAVVSTDALCAKLNAKKIHRHVRACLSLKTVMAVF